MDIHVCIHVYIGKSRIYGSVDSIFKGVVIKLDCSKGFHFQINTLIGTWIRGVSTY